MITTHQTGAALNVLLAARAINPLSRLFQRELAALLDRLEQRRTPLGAIIISFDAEASVNHHEREHLMALTPAQAGDCMQMLSTYNALLRRLETLDVAVVAVLSGDISGHAFAFALACHHRLALRQTRFSQPQAGQGLTPVAGGIARTVRLAGLQAALPLLLEGATLSADQAQRAGLLHAVADSQAQLAALAISVQHSIRTVQPWDAKQATLPRGVLDSAPLRPLLQTTPAMLRERAGGPSPAAEAALCAMVEGLLVDFENALLIESRYFCQTAITSPLRKSGFSL
ncbi:hypothetical protein GTP58_28575 [Duganella sp. CY15W]|uniref:enoyl-CoA hydratase/isomerase family protein n=1 Tax=Duganella sp. CY15W TaxID=2692172 RepID=UPI0013717D7D|nr:enoyl-CoA hydratase/isomerase family protein [Duganella sp. CY15W]MYM32292.1 hypothetical protein [Duganella sp. CY15W]